jgi:hypothetical protein
VRRAAHPALLELRAVALLGPARHRCHRRLARQPHAGSPVPLVAGRRCLRTAPPAGRSGERDRPPGDVAACGRGGTNSSLRVQIVADVTRRTILLGSEDEVSAKGAAVLAVAYVSHGGNPGIAAATAAMAWPVRVVEPDLQGAKAYDVYYDVYRDLYPSLRETLRKLAAGAATAS